MTADSIFLASWSFHRPGPRPCFASLKVWRLSFL